MMALYFRIAGFTFETLVVLANGAFPPLGWGEAIVSQEHAGFSCQVIHTRIRLYEILGSKGITVLLTGAAEKVSQCIWVSQLCERMSKPELYLNDQITKMITYYNEFSIPHPLCKYTALFLWWKRIEYKNFCVLRSWRATFKKCWSHTQKMSLRSKALSQKLVGRVTGRLTKGWMWCSLAKRAWNACCPPWFFSASTGSPMLLQRCTGT